MRREGDGLTAATIDLPHTEIESKSRPGHIYPMVLAPVSGWVHADQSCPAFEECWHRIAAAIPESHPDYVAFHPRTAEERRFWSHVKVSDGCWLWTGSHDKYGHFGRGSLRDDTRRTENAHVVAFEFAYWKAKALVCHECDTPLCCRPRHLFEGTPTANAQDAVNKGRLGRKLTWREVRAIRARNEAGESINQLAIAFGLSRGYAWKVIAKVAWKEAKKMTSLTVRGATDIALHSVLLVEYDAAAISQGVDPKLVAKWAYRRPGDEGGAVEGVSARGAEEGTRLLSKYGEIIRADPPVLANDSEREAFFLCTASRFVIGGDGTEIKLDSQTRGKRVSKFDRHSANWIKDHPRADPEYPVKNWYEIGVSKVQRNAILAMMPSNVKSALLAAGLSAAQGGPQPERQETRPQQNRQASRQQQSAPESQPNVVEGEVVNRETSETAPTGPSTAPQHKAMTENANRLGWSASQLLTNIAENLQISVETLEALTAAQATTTIGWQAGLLKARNKAAVTV